MTVIRNLHQKAMELADLAVVSRIRGDLYAAQEYFKQAYNLEKKAAEEYFHNFEAEPTRSVLYRSAASLALDAGEAREAERLASCGLIGNPPDVIANELRSVVEKANFQRHMDLKGVRFSDDNSFQMSLAGRDAYPGAAPSDIVLDRLTNIYKVVYRTIDRMSGTKYRVGGVSAYSSQIPTYFVSPQDSSFAVRVIIGEPNQPVLPGLESYNLVQNVIKEIMDCLEILNNGEAEGLRQRIEEPVYYNNFIGLAEKIAPDGERINFVGFTASSQGRERRVALTLPQNKISTIHKLVSGADADENSESDLVTQAGRLLYADAFTNKGKIKLKLSTGTKITILVPEGLDDIVSQLWNQDVVVRGKKRGKNSISLVSIDKADPS